MHNNNKRDGKHKIKTIIPISSFSSSSSVYSPLRLLPPVFPLFTHLLTGIKYSIKSELREIIAISIAFILRVFLVDGVLGSNDARDAQWLFCFCFCFGYFLEFCDDNISLFYLNEKFSVVVCSGGVYLLYVTSGFDAQWIFDFVIGFMNINMLCGILLAL